MHFVRRLLYVLLWVFVVVVAVGTVLSVLANTESRYLKFLDFPRIQFFWLGVVALALSPLVTRKFQWYDYALMVALLAGIGIQVSYLVNYTGLTAKTLPDAPAGTPDGDRLSVLIANVEMDNRDAGPLLDLITERSPDLVLAMETDAWWDDALADVEARYPYGEEVINDEAYGMVLYSRLPLRGTTVRYLQNESVPSFATTVALPGGREVDLHTVHPVPPTRFQRFPDNEGQREAEMLRVGELVAAAPPGRPAIVMGDFNDVAWAATDRLTGTDDLLHDVRTGRGIYSTYDAQNPLLRWPLDHIFATDGIGVVAFERLGDINSDHFPVYAELAVVD